MPEWLNTVVSRLANSNNETCVSIDHITMMPHELYGVSNHRQLYCIFSSLLLLTLKKKKQSSLLLAPCEENPSVSDGFPSQRTSIRKVCPCLNLAQNAVYCCYWSMSLWFQWWTSSWASSWASLPHFPLAGCCMWWSHTLLSTSSLSCCCYCSRVAVVTGITKVLFYWEIWACFLSLARSKLRLCSANNRAGYLSNLACRWLSIVWAYSQQETENRPCWKWQLNDAVSQ